MSNHSCIKYDYLESYAAENASAYLAADPFPHAVIDHVLYGMDAQGLAIDFPDSTSPQWYQYENVFEKKRITQDFDELPRSFKQLLFEANSSRFVRFLERLTGIKGLIPDPHHTGGGLHQSVTGGKLDIHADFNWHGEMKLDRRVNVLLYFNKHWKPEWGGDLELWDNNMSGAVRKIEPLLNRMVVFNTTDTSYHGHPDPLSCPVGLSRKSVALYYYTNGRPEHEKTERHSTLYQPRPQDEVTPELEDLRQRRAQGKLT